MSELLAIMDARSVSRIMDSAAKSDHTRIFWYRLGVMDVLAQLGVSLEEYVDHLEDEGADIRIDLSVSLVPSEEGGEGSCG